MDPKSLHTPLHAAHVRQGARMVPFAGWEMPIQYIGILAEARAVRSVMGIFDVSHMGRIVLKGPQAQPLLDWIHTADIGETMAIGRARYGLICNEAGGIIDDGIIYKLDTEQFMLVANAANSPVVLAWLRHWIEQKFPDVTIDDQTKQLSMLALQGPESMRLLTEISTFNPDTVRSFHCSSILVRDQEILVARTGYTGEDGVELMPRAKDTEWLWNIMLDNGVVPCGLGARDVLRLEAGLALHGNDIDLSTNPYEAGLGRFVDPDRPDYVAGEALRHIREEGHKRSLVGFNMVGRGIARQGHPIMDGSELIGAVTSGGVSPTLDRNIGMGYVPMGFSDPGTRFQIDVRGRLVEAEVTALPFYSRKRSA